MKTVAPKGKRLQTSAVAKPQVKKTAVISAKPKVTKTAVSAKVQVKKTGVISAKPKVLKTAVGAKPEDEGKARIVKVEAPLLSRRERKFKPDSERKSVAEPDKVQETVGIRFEPGVSGSCPYDIDAAVLHISKRDKVMGKLIQKVGDFRLELDEMLTPFETLAESIVYQQLTGKVAATIFSRVKALFGGSRLPGPEVLMNTEMERLRGAGLSTAKALALRDLAEKQHLGLLPDARSMEDLSNEEIIERLTVVRGIGRWTVEMLLIFKLGRPDVLPVNDYGVRKGFARTFKLEELPTPRELGAHGEKWGPYRSVAAWYLWRALDLPENKGKR